MTKQSCCCFDFKNDDEMTKRTLSALLLVIEGVKPTQFNSHSNIDLLILLEF